MLREANAKAGQYITETSEAVRSAIQAQVMNAYNRKLTPVELASDLYWMKDDKPEMKQYTAEILMRDWRRVAYTELAMVTEAAKTAPLINQARKSIDDTALAVYYVFSGPGRCEWCDAHMGTIVRLLPPDVAGGADDDSLSGYGIKDPHTKIGYWPGKVNVGRPKAQWQVTAPAHPWCSCTMVRIDPGTQVWDEDQKRVVPKMDKETEELYTSFLPTSFLEALENEKAKKAQRQEAILKRQADEHKPYYPSKQP